MLLGLGQVVADWPFAVSLAAAASARGLRAGRRRAVLNEALHELRRPLQALVLAAPRAEPATATALDSSVQMAAAALARLEREINGTGVPSTREPLALRPLLEAATARWRRSAALRGGSVRLLWEAGEVVVDADRGEISQALDNLIVNALEHGGPEVVVTAAPGPLGLSVTVADPGRGPRASARREGPAAAIARLTGRRRHGHGLRVVRRIAAAHGGGFRLRCSEAGTEARLDLPLSGGAG